MSARHDDSDEKPGDERKRFKEYECPECTANNPMDDGIAEGDEVRCFYCGLEFKVQVRDGKLKLKSV